MSTERLRTAEAAKHFGNKRKLSLALGLTTSAVSQWGEFVPLIREYQIRQLMMGITPRELEGKSHDGKGRAA